MRNYISLFYMYTLVTSSGKIDEVGREIHMHETVKWAEINLVKCWFSVGFVESCPLLCLLVRLTGLARYSVPGFSRRKIGRKY